MSNQLINLNGHVANEPKYEVKNDLPRCKLKMRVIQFSQRKDEARSVYYNCTFWGRDAESASKYAEKGRALEVTGALHVIIPKDRDGHILYTPDGEPDIKFEVDVKDYRYHSNIPNQDSQEQIKSKETQKQTTLTEYDEEPFELPF